MTRMSIVKQFMGLPMFLKLVWLCLLVGVGYLAAGYLSRDASHNILGASLFFGGYAAGLADVWLRKRERVRAARFHVALVFAPVIAFFLGLAVVAVSGLIWLVISLIHGFSIATGLRALHFAGILVLVQLVIGMPAIMKFGEKRKAARRAA